VNEQPLASPEQADQLVRAFRLDLRLVRMWPLAGAVSSKVTCIEVRGVGGLRCTLVLRQYGAANLRAEPRIAHNEYRLLKLLSALACRCRGPSWSSSRARSCRGRAC
jgi:hypothetical protein